MGSSFIDVIYANRSSSSEYHTSSGISGATACAEREGLDYTRSQRGGSTRGRAVQGADESAGDYKLTLIYSMSRAASTQE